MFGFGDMDMAMGAGLEMNGAMDMAEGMMLTQMGMPGLGAMQMGIGAMEMGMGQTMMDVGMMENMYDGYGMGYGMGYGGMMGMDTALMMGCMGIGCTLACCNPGMYRRAGCMGIGCTLSCCNTGIFRHRKCLGIGCRLPCCHPRRRLFGNNCMGVGCTLPCCSKTTTEVIIIDGNRGGQQYQQYQGNNYTNQYQNGYQYQNQGQYQNQNQYVNQGQYRNFNPNQQQQQNFQQTNQKVYQPNQQQQNYQNVQQQNYQNTQKNTSQPENQVKPTQVQQQTKTQQISNTLYPEISQYKESVYNGKQQMAMYNVNQSLGDENLQQYKNDYFPNDKNHGFENDNTFNENTVYHGKLFKRIGFNWTEHPQAILTKHNLLDMSVQGMTKVKIKKEMGYQNNQNTSFLKITTMMTQDHFFGCYQNQQLEWFVSIIWAKMALLNKASDRFAEFNGHIEGQILRKSQFLGNWQYRFVKINSSGLKSHRNPHMMPTLSLTSIQQLWCRFEYLHGGNYLVIKCKSAGIKYEYGIPVQYVFPWIKAFYSLMI